jgi:4a-hydroxytetrahydrobiopterin dehydratase
MTDNKSALHQKPCLPCQGGIPPIADSERERLIKELDNWIIVDNHHLFKEYSFKNYNDAFSFVSKVCLVADEENHHPDVEFGWGYARIKIFTHKIDNLVEADFILAAKIDRI